MTIDKPRRTLVALCVLGATLGATAAWRTTQNDSMTGDGTIAYFISDYEPALQRYLYRVALNEQHVAAFDATATDANATAAALAAEATLLAECTPANVDASAAHDAATAVREHIAKHNAQPDRRDKFAAATSELTFPQPDCATVGQELTLN